MITVVFSTYNGSRTLPAMLTSLTRLEAPEGGWRLIAVDNASTDDTALILARFRDRLPIQVLFQPRRGKNAALNLALPHLDGELVIFTDDDIIAPVSWLRSYDELCSAKQDFDIFGGRVVPRWPGPVPRAILESVPLGPAFAIHSENLEEGPIGPGMIWGPNMAIRRRLFDQGVRFDEEVGPSAGNYTMGSETELTRRLNRSGHRCWFADSIQVEHQIRPEQLSRGWIAGRARRFAKLLVHNERRRPSKEDVAMIFGVPRWRYRALAGSKLRELFGLLTRNEIVALHGLWQANLQLGAILEYRRLERIQS